MSHGVSGARRASAVAAALVAASFAAGICAICDVASALDAAPALDTTAPPPLEAAAPSTQPTASAAAEPSGSSAQPTAPATAGTTAGPSGNIAGPSGTAEDIRDIRGPKFIWPAWLVPALLAGTVLLAWLGRTAWRWLHRRPRARVLLPFEVALQRLENLRSLMQPDRAREFSTEVSGIIRDYIEQRFDVTATHQTTEEFLHDLLTSPNAALAKHRVQLSAFLHQCDLVKFAGMALTLRSMESLHASARTFVLETAKPEETTAKPEETTAKPEDSTAKPAPATVAAAPTVAAAATVTPTAAETRAGAHAPAPRAPAPGATAAKEAHDSLPSA